MNQYIGLIFRNVCIPDLSQADVRLQLAQEDAQDLTKLSTPPGSDVSASSMIHIGLELEELR